MFKRFSAVFAPQPVLLLITVLMAALLLMVTWLALHQPWMGLELVPAGEAGLRVKSVNEKGALIGKIEGGEIIRAIVWRGEPISLAYYDPAYNPNVQPDFAGYREYLRWQSGMHAALQSPPFTLLLDDQQQITVTSLTSRPLSTLPASFWVLNTFGLIACLIGVFVWVFLPGYWPARLLAISGASFFLAMLTHGVWEARELALSEVLFDVLKRVNHVGMYSVLASLCILLSIYPSRIGKGNVIPALIVTATVFILVNENITFLDLPVHTFYLPIPFYYLSAFAFSIRQWQLSRHRPVERASLRWLLFSMLVSPGAGLTLYFVPLLFSLPPIMKQSVMVGLVALMYVGFAIGILRYRLFQLEMWWFTVWAWFLGGLAVIVIDMMVMVSFRLNHTTAMIVAVVFVGWIYFPIRQWAWNRFSTSNEIPLEKLLPSFVESMLVLPPDRVSGLWRETLQRVFQPLTIETSAQAVREPELLSRGTMLRVPDIGSQKGPGLDLRHGKNGRHLFTIHDLQLVMALGAVALRISSLEQARRLGAQEERRRIMRDLHDDVGGRLLTLIHSAKDDQQEELARAALGALRESIHTLDDRRRYSINELLEEWQPLLLARLAAAGWTLRKHIDARVFDIPLSARYYVNLRRILDEAVTNVLEHGRLGELVFSLQREGGTIVLTLENLIADTPVNGDFSRGRGLYHMLNRAQELEGELLLCCRAAPDHCFVLKLTLPIEFLIVQTGSYQAVRIG